jgi:ligand-binding sensor domain-containing protein
MLVLPHTTRLWVGCDDGRIWVLDGATEELLATFKPSSSPVTSLAAVGRGAEVWCASERAVCVLDPATGALRYALAQLEGSAEFVKALLPWRWGLWVMSLSGLRLLAARSAWEAAAAQVRGGGVPG